MKEKLFLFVLAINCFLFAYAQDNSKEINWWRYRYASDWYLQNDSVMCQNIYSWNFYCTEYVEEINGRKYEYFFSEPEAFPVAETRNVEADAEHFYALLVRRENGCVYADYQDYLKYISHGEDFLEGSHANPDYIPYHRTNDGEIILYDYNMKIGDKYCSVDGYEDISVVEKDVVTFEDGAPRRRLKLSNNLILIEGIGCINSNGMLLDYLNPSNEYANNFTYLSEAYCLDTRIYKNSLYKVFDMQNNRITQLTGKLNMKAPLFDLQGRPVQGSPKHGVYIQNGKKVMR